MLEFLNELFKIKNNKIKIHFSEGFVKFLSEYNIVVNNELLEYDEKSDFCFVDITDKNGFVKVMPSVKYLYLLKNYKLDVDKYKNNFPLFLKEIKDEELVNRNFQYMRSGRLIKKLLNIDPYDIESFVIRYKYFQDNYYSNSSNQ